MTKQEYIDLYDALFYGHDAELTLLGHHYFLEWSSTSMEIYLLEDGNGTRIASISAQEKKDILAELFEFMFIEKKNLNNSYTNFEIVDIE